jgi:hypothetical protein
MINPLSVGATSQTCTYLGLLTIVCLKSYDPAIFDMGPEHAAAATVMAATRWYDGDIIVSSLFPLFNIHCVLLNFHPRRLISEASSTFATLGVPCAAPYSTALNTVFPARNPKIRLVAKLSLFRHWYDFDEHNKKNTGCSVKIQET